MYAASDGARLLFVGLGCPKQERWIVDHLGRVPAVMLAVGAAIDFIPGSKSRCPRWMSRHGLEWVYRFVTEPRCLAMRYLKHNPRFVSNSWVSYSRGKIERLFPYTPRVQLPPAHMAALYKIEAEG